jgi:hypothetical protein
LAFVVVSEPPATMEEVDESYRPYRIAGAYFESCNCDAICPCRTIGGVPGGRSTHGICFGALSWQIREGTAGDVDLDGLNAAMVYRYSDDEEGSPWEFRVHVDARGSERQRVALAEILVGRLGGTLMLAMPWVRKPSDLLEVRTSRIQIEHRGREAELKIGETVTARASRAVDTSERVSCIVAGHQRPGTELYADELRVADEPFDWELAGNCAFVSDFEYASDD